MALCNESFFRFDVIQQQLRDDGLEGEDDFRLGYVAPVTNFDEPAFTALT